MRTVADLFCGIGGAGLGAVRAGWSVVLAIDRDLCALRCYQQAVRPRMAICADLAVYPPLPITVDLLFASPPCPPWSEGTRRAGRTHGDAHPDGKLLYVPLRWVEVMRPTWVVIENVDGIPDSALARLTAPLEQVYPHVVVLRLNAKHWTPQERGHVFVVAGPRPFPIPASNERHAWAEVRDDSQVRYVQLVPSRAALRFWNEPIVTVTTRPFSHRQTCVVWDGQGWRYPNFVESARAQGFPDDHPVHRLPRSRAWRYVGNAVPVPLAQALFSAIGLAGE